MANSKKRKSTRARATKTERSDETGTRSSHHKGLYRLTMILSPAKTLNLDDDAKDLPVPWTKPLDTIKSERTKVVTAVKKHSKSAAKLGALLKTSAKITSTAQGYWKELSADGAQTPHTNRKPAIMTFNGAAYAGLNVRDSIANDQSKLQYLQDHLRIVDPLYGWLRPMDAIEAYRLEMASRGVFDANKKLKLEEFWKPGIASCLNAEQEQQSSSSSSSSSSSAPIVVVNLASDEYSAAVDRPMVKIVFKHGGRTIAVHAKRARGLMVRYAALNAIESVDDLVPFDLEGYSHQPDQSTYSPEGGIESLLQELNNGDDDEETNKEPKKKRTRKKQEPLTLVFDRPGTWKKSN